MKRKGLGKISLRFYKLIYFCLDQSGFRVTCSWEFLCHFANIVWLFFNFFKYLGLSHTCASLILKENNIRGFSKQCGETGKCWSPAFFTFPQCFIGLLFPPFWSSQSFPKCQISESSKLKEFAEDNCKFDESGRELSKLVENNVGKGEIAHYEQFILFQQCFQRTCTVDK